MYNKHKFIGACDWSGRRSVEKNEDIHTSPATLSEPCCYPQPAHRFSASSVSLFRTFPQAVHEVVHGISGNQALVHFMYLFDEPIHFLFKNLVICVLARDFCHRVNDR